MIHLYNDVTRNTPPVLSAGRPPPLLPPWRRDLRGRVWSLPHHEGQPGDGGLTPVKIFIYSQVGPLFGVPVDLFSPVENKVSHY